MRYTPSSCYPKDLEYISENHCFSGLSSSLSVVVIPPSNQVTTLRVAGPYFHATTRTVWKRYHDDGVRKRHDKTQLS